MLVNKLQCFLNFDIIDGYNEHCSINLIYQSVLLLGFFINDFFLCLFFKEKRQKQTVVTCLGCGTLRRFVYNNKTVPWVDRPEAWVDIVMKGQSVSVQQQGKAKGSKQVCLEAGMS